MFDDKRPKIRILGGGSGIAGDGLDVRVVGVIGDLVVTGEVGGAGGVDVGDVGDVGAGGVDVDVDVGDVGVDVDVGAELIGSRWPREGMAKRRYCLDRIVARQSASV